VEGPLKLSSLNSFLQEHVPRSLEEMGGLNEVRGYVCYRFHVAASGRVKGLVPLASTLVSPEGRRASATAWSRRLGKKLAGFEFAKSRGETRLTLPLQFS
jgi:hypothetical protein